MSRTTERDTMECIVTPITKRLVRPHQDPIVYVAGPMRGIDDFNFPAFDEARDYVVGLEKFNCISPADVDREEQLDLPDVHDVPENVFQLCMRRDLEIVANAHAIFLLKGWENSTGANNELFVANVCGVEVWIAQYDGRGRLVDHVVAEEPVVPPKVGAPVPAPETRSVLEEANGLIFGPRQDMYGHPVDDFSRTGRLWGATLENSIREWVAASAEDDTIPYNVPPQLVGLCMVEVKISREVNRPKRDNRVDMAGYAGCVDRVSEKLGLDQ
jgi:hypothetical protein